MYRFFLDDESFFDLLSDLIKESFSINAKNYENINLGHGIVDLRLLIIGVFAGLVIASYAAFFHRRITGKFVRSLIKCGADSPENSKTLKELGLEKSFYVRRAIKKEYVYRSVVSCTERERYYENIKFFRDGEKTQPEETAESGANSKDKSERYSASPFEYDFETNTFYVDRENVQKAEKRFSASASDVIAPIIVTLLAPIATVVTLKFLPELLLWLDNAISGFKS